MSSQGSFYPLNPCNLVPYLGQDQASLGIGKSCFALNSLLSHPGRQDWLEAGFIDRKTIIYLPQTLIAANITIKTPSKAFDLFLLDPDSGATYAFNLYQGQVNAIIKHPSEKAKIYKNKEDHQIKLVKKRDYKAYQSWKNNCNLSRFHKYAIYWLWSRVSTNKDDYDGFGNFWESLVISYDDKIVKITYPERDKTKEVVFQYKEWKSSQTREDFKEWVDFCDWKSRYYSSRAQHHQDRDSTIWQVIGQCKGKLGIGFTLEANRIIWLINGYQAYSYPITRKITRLHVGIGLGYGRVSGRIVEITKFGLVIPCLDHDSSSDVSINSCSSDVSISTCNSRSSNDSCDVIKLNRSGPISLVSLDCDQKASSSTSSSSCTSKSSCSCSSRSSCTSSCSCSCSTSTSSCSCSCSSSSKTCSLTSITTNKSSCSIISLVTPKKDNKKNN